VRWITTAPSGVINAGLGIGQHNWDDPAHLAIGQTGMHHLFKTLALEPAGPAVELAPAATELAVTELTFTDPLQCERQISGEQLLNRRIFNDALLVMHNNEVIHESYRNGMCNTDRHVVHSCTKSFCAMLAAIAIDEGKLDPNHQVSHYMNDFAHRPEWQGVSIQHLLDMRAGIEYSEDYTDPDAHYWHYARAVGYYPPLPGESAIGARAWATANLNQRSHPPGEVFAYNSCLTMVLGMVLENIYQRPLAELFEKRLYQRIGAETDAYFNTDPQGFPIVEGQLSLRLRDFARWASLVVNGGRNLVGEQVIPAEFVQQLTTPDPLAQVAYHRKDPDPVFPDGQYKNKFWVFDPTANQLSMIGIHGQFAWYDLNRNLMLVGVGSFPRQDGELMMRSLNTLWQGINDHI
jgi:CubicO group peptidase (beta-lactamase class C family)